MANSAIAADYERIARPCFVTAIFATSYCVVAFAVLVYAEEPPELTAFTRKE